ncbi:site-specific integrase, partial [candidate division KSB1 bacterium]|nr:site-specific integrase [candidate division KSB1 bacterium]
FMMDRIRYRGVGGATKTQALRTQEKIRNRVICGEYDLVQAAGRKKIEDFSEVYLSRRRHLKSRKRDELSVRILLRYFKGRSLGSILPANIEDYIAKRRENGVANGTINRELACLKRMYNLAIRWKEANKNPVNEVDFLKEPPGRTRFLTPEEAGRLLECCNESLRPIVFTALNTGMRRMEILSLTWDNVHIDSVIDPYIEIPISKNYKKRFVPLSTDMIELLEKLRNRHQTFVFIGMRGRPVKTVRKPFETALRKAGIINFRFHDLRHTFASHFIMHGGDPLTLKEILGHSSLKMVERYAHLAVAHKRKQINNLNGVFSDCHLFATSAKVANLSSR